MDTSPFLGMDPYLEDPQVWPGFHHALAEEIRAQLNDQIGPKYFADVEVRTVMQELGVAARQVMYPDAAILERKPRVVRETAVSTLSPTKLPPAPVRRPVTLPTQTRLRAVQIYVTETAELITTIEILSPFNKQAGDGVEEYRRKRRRVLQADLHLVEIDLLRGGLRPGAEVAYPPLAADYVLLVNRANPGAERVSDIWPVALPETMPTLPIPLAAPDADATLELTAVLQSVYRRGGYGWRLDYSLPVPPPALTPEMSAWVTQLLAQL